MTSIYEYPLHERVRLFMRLEHIFAQMDKFSHAKDYYNAQLFLSALFDVIELFNHYDVRTEIIKELNTYKSSMLKENFICLFNQTEIHEYSGDINQALQNIHAFNFNSLNRLRDNYFLANLRRQNFNLKNYLFETPILQYWIKKHEQENDETHNFFLKTNLLFQDISNAIFLILDLIRNSAEVFSETVTTGSLMKNLDKEKCNQMVRVFLADHTDLYPIINGDRNRVMVRFYRQENTEIKAIHAEKEVIHFKYHICTN